MIGMLDDGALVRRMSPPARPGEIVIGAVSIDAIVRAVAFHVGVPAIGIIGRDRAPSLLRARRAVAWAARQLTPATLVQIGVALGGLDHSTVSFAIARAERLRDRDPAFHRLTARLIAEFRAPKKEN